MAGPTTRAWCLLALLLIAVSCPSEPGFKQSAYLFAAQVACAGLAAEDLAHVEDLICAASVAKTYKEYVR